MSVVYVAKAEGMGTRVKQKVKFTAKIPFREFYKKGERKCK